MLREPAMSDRRSGRGAVGRPRDGGGCYAKGNNLIAVGEMGIGNTTAASVMTAALTGMPASLVTGKGTGLDERGVCPQMPHRSKRF